MEKEILEEETKALQVRFPLKMYERLTKRAKKARRSLNAEIITCLEEYFAWQDEREENRKKMETMTPERLEAVNKLMRKIDIIEIYAKAHPDEFPL